MDELDRRVAAMHQPIVILANRDSGDWRPAGIATAMSAEACNGCQAKPTVQPPDPDRSGVKVGKNYTPGPEAM